MEIENIFSIEEFEMEIKKYTKKFETGIITSLELADIIYELKRKVLVHIEKLVETRQLMYSSHMELLYFLTDKERRQRKQSIQFEKDLERLI